MDTPQFAEFAKAVAEFYKHEEIKPALHVSCLLPEKKGEVDYPERWFISIHRYPHGRINNREVVISQVCPSFGVALTKLWQEWLLIRDPEWLEEQSKKNTLYEQTGRRGRRRRNASSNSE